MTASSTEVSSGIVDGEEYESCQCMKFLTTLERLDSDE